MARLSLFAVLALAAASLGSPLAKRAPPTDRGIYRKCPINPSSTSPPAQCYSTDAPYSIAENTLYQNIQCNNASSTSSVTKPWLLVTGTGATGPEAWQVGYVKLLSNLGYSPCTISPPPYMLGDLQILSEYVSYATNALAAASGKQVPVISWSAGGLISQWSNTFRYSARGNTQLFIPFAPDYLGTLDAIFANATTGTAPPSVHQQASSSQFIKNLRRKGGCGAWVPTTTIFSQTDEVVTPELGETPASTSYLYSRGGSQTASNIEVQAHCLLLNTVYDHAFSLWNAFSYSAVLAALKSPNLVTPHDFNADCSDLPAKGLTPANAIQLNAGELTDAQRIADPQYFTPTEPPTIGYVSNYPDLSCN